MIPPEHDMSDASLGYTSAASEEAASKLDETTARRIAAMALRWYDSAYSDRDVDLGCGLAQVLGRDPEE